MRPTGNEADATHGADAAAQAGARPWWRGPGARRAASVLAGVLIVGGLVTAPLAVVAAHARQQLVHTDTFVAAYAPLARDPEVQALVVAAVTDAFTRTDLAALVERATDGMTGLPLPDGAAELLGDLDEAALTARVETMAREVVASDTFATLWERSLRGSHGGIRAVLEGDSVVSVDDLGTVRLELGPVVEEVRRRLVDSGWWIAWLIPQVDLALTVTEIPALGAFVRTAGRIDTAGTWLPVVTVVALAVGVGIARRRRSALVLAAAGVALGMGLLAAGVVVGRGAVVAAVTDSRMRLTEPATRAIYDAATAASSGTALTVGVVAAVVAAGAGLAGRDRLPWAGLSRAGGAGGDA